MYILQQINWISIVENYKRSIPCKLYKIYNNLTSPLLNDLATKSTSSRVSQNALKIEILSFRYVDYKQLFKYRATHIWNNIPMEICELKSSVAFKQVLKKSGVLKKIFFTKSISGKASIGISILCVTLLSILEFVFYSFHLISTWFSILSFPTYRPLRF